MSYTAARLHALTPEEKRALLAKVLEQRSSAPQQYPLSFAQQRLWFLDQLTPGNPFYAEAAALRLPYLLDDGVIRRALDEIVRRHATLRTVFEDGTDGPVQTVLPGAASCFSTVDLSSSSQEEREAEAARLASAEAAEPFDLKTGPLARFKYLKLASDDSVLLLTMHHIVCDGWSMNVFLRELSALYEAFSQDLPSPLPDLTIQYTDFALWQREHLTGEALAEQIAYWKQRLHGLTTLRLPADFARPAAQTFKGAAHRLEFARELHGRLNKLAQENDSTLFMVLLSAWAALLHRHSGQSDIMVGCPIANRTRAETEGLIGFFVNSIIMRVDVSGDPSFRSLISRVRGTALEAYEHQDLPFEKLVEELSPERDMSRNPLFQVTFQLFASPDADPTTAEPEAPLEFQLERITAKFDLRLDVYEYSGGLSGLIEYNTDLFAPESIERMGAEYLRLVDEMAADPDLPVSRAALLAPEERSRILADSAAARVHFPTGLLLQSLVEQQVERTPDAVAVVCGRRQVTYSELDARATALAALLQREHGVGPDVLVAVCMDRSVELVVSLLAVLKAGGAYVPLDPQYPAERISFLLDDSNAAVVIALRSERREALLSRANVVFVDDVAQSGERPRCEANPENVAYVIYTSGTTGRPKGVLVPHRAIVNHMFWMAREFPLTGADSVLQRTPISFDASVWEFYAPLMAGARLVLAPPAPAADTRCIVDTIRAERVTVLQTVPSLLRLLVDEPRFAACTSLQRIFCGGEALRSDLVRAVKRLLPVRVVNLYGPTETAIDATFAVCDAGERSAVQPIGRPISNLRVYVVDEHGKLQPTGVPGELWIGGAGVALGYLNRPELTSARFLPDVFAGEGMIYRTGDIVRWRNDGQLEFLGRSDEQVKVRGFRIELAEIETLLGEHADVKTCAVEARGGEDLVAWVAPRKVPAADSADQRVAGWQEVFDHVYDQRSDEGSDPAFRIAGWERSDTGEAIAAVEMQEWVDETVARILALRPRRVLEIGAGTGLLLFRIAPSTEEYVATDFSPAAVDRLKREAAMPHVRVEQRRADEFEGIGGPFDVIILNSVVQYFPDAQYLALVLSEAMKLLLPGGRIFIGDVRNREQVAAFHAWVEWRRYGRGKADWQRARRRMQREKELVISPELFRRIGGAISGVEVQPKLGRWDNEMTRFRYDVVLESAETPPDTAPPTWVEWSAVGRAGMSRLLAEAAGGAIVAVRGVPSGWWTEALGVVRALERGGQPESPGREVCEPGEWRTEGVDVHVRYGSEPGCYDVLLRAGEARPWLDAVDPAAEPLDWGQWTNQPHAGRAQQQLVAELRGYLAERLPEYMIPSRWVVLDDLPVSPNGKLDRRALPEPDDEEAPTGASVGPRNAVEAELARIWAEVLGRSRVGVTENFFHLGGHSLLATQLVSRIRKSLHVDLPLRSVFEAPTIAQEAEEVARIQKTSAMRAEPALTRLPREQYRRTEMDAGLR